MCFSSNGLSTLNNSLSRQCSTHCSEIHCYHCLCPNVCVCVSSRVRPLITLTGACAGDRWTAQSLATSWRKASTQAAPLVWVTRTPTIQRSPRRKKSLQPARASLTLSLCVALTIKSIHSRPPEKLLMKRIFVVCIMFMSVL